jgi:hypothetical protein
MKNSVKKELAEHILDKINDGIINDENRDEWHFYCFNEDYYIIGYYEASQWLKRHYIGEFEAAGICQQYEIDNFGESKVYDNSEQAVNMLAYIYGEELIYSLDAENIGDLEIKLNKIINF